MPQVTTKVQNTQCNVQLFPLSPEAVRRLRQHGKSAKVSYPPTRRDVPKATQAMYLLRALLRQ